MSASNRFVVFALDGQRFALYCSAVSRVVRIVEITPLPQAPGIVRGMVNAQGQVIPVFDIRKRFHLPEREIDLSNQLVIANTARRSVALVVDEVTGVVESREQEVITAEKILPGTDYVEGVIKLEDGLILIHDLDKFLSLEEDRKLDAALKIKKKR